MIPEEKAEAVARAMRETFGVTDFEDIIQMTKGNSTSRVFRIVVRGTAYLLRMSMRQDSPARHYANHRAAAEAGLAPKVWYANAGELARDIGNYLSGRETLADCPAVYLSGFLSWHSG